MGPVEVIVRGSLREAHVPTFRVSTVNIPMFITCWPRNGIGSLVKQRVVTVLKLVLT